METKHLLLILIASLGLLVAADIFLRPDLDFLDQPVAFPDEAADVAVQPDPSQGILPEPGPVSPAPGGMMLERDDISATGPCPSCSTIVTGPINRLRTWTDDMASYAVHCPTCGDYLMAPFKPGRPGKGWEVVKMMSFDD